MFEEEKYMKEILVLVNDSQDEGVKAKLSRAAINRLPDKSFLYIEPGGEKDADGLTTPRRLRHLPVYDAQGNVMLPQLRNALSRLGQPATGETEEGRWLTGELRKRLQAKARRILAEEQKSIEDRLDLLSEIETEMDDKQTQCVCPECGYEADAKGECGECPECDVDMLTGAEAVTAGVSAGRATTTQAAAGVESQVKGGPGSGNFGHAGRPGQRGGSAPGGGGVGGKYGELPRGSSAERIISQRLNKRAYDYGYGDNEERMEDLDRLPGGREWAYGQMNKDVDEVLDARIRHTLTRGGRTPVEVGAVYGSKIPRVSDLIPFDELDEMMGSGMTVEKIADEAFSRWDRSEAIDIVSRGVASRREDFKGAEGKKAGRRVRGDKVTLLKRLAKEFQDLGKVLKEFVGWADYDDEIDTDSFDIAALLDEAATAKALKQAAETGSSIMVFPSHDGRDWLLTFTTNAFKDREKEIFTTKSIEDYVDRHQHDDIKGEYQFWHLPGTKFGDIRWQGMVGRFLAEAGPFDDTEVGQAFKQFFNQHPDGHSEIAPHGWGCSHRYEYKAHDRVDGVYNWFDKSETTVLPSHVAANAHNPSLSTKEDDSMNDRQRAALKVIGGNSLVNLVEEVGLKATAELEGAVDYKAKNDLPAQLQAIVDATEDEKAKSGISAVIKAMRKMPPWLEEDDDKPKGKKEEEVAEEAPSTPDGEAPAEDVPVEETLTEEAPAEDAPTEDVPTEEAPAPAEVPAAETEAPATADKAYQDAIAASFVAITDHIKDQFTDVKEQFAEVHNAVKSIADEVAILKQDDETKIAAKAELTPAASLQEIVDSVIGNKATRVRQNSTYAKDGPKQNEDDFSDGPSRVPLLNMFMSGADQRREQ